MNNTDDLSTATAALALDPHKPAAHRISTPSPAEVASLLSNISPEVHARIEAFQRERSFKSRPSSARSQLVPVPNASKKAPGPAAAVPAAPLPAPHISVPVSSNSAPPKPAHIAYKTAIPDYSQYRSSPPTSASSSAGSTPALGTPPFSSPSASSVSSPLGPGGVPLQVVAGGAVPTISGPLYNASASTTTSKLPPSLSARRGLKLDGPPMSLSLSLNSTAPALTGQSVSVPAMSSKNPGFKLDIGAINNTSTPNPSSRELLANTTSIPKPPSPTSARHPNPRGPPGGLSLGIGSKPENIFSSHGKYIDVKTGSLNFAGKASLHSKGIDFSSGCKFRISLDELEPLGELGRGNYGTVTKVCHKPTGIIMAMKEIRLELEEAKFLQIIMELEILHKCVSPYIVDFYGAFFVEGAVYLCMEYMDGGSLDKIYHGGVDEPYLAVITDCVIRGLKQLKDHHNIIHRDVKPTNILVSTSGKVKLCDFGVSGNLVASIAKTNIGCQSYMAPERIKAANPDDVLTYTAQSDIWSLGLSVLEVAKGCYPYPADTYRNLFSQLSAIIYGDTPSLPADRFSPEARSFVENCLNKSPMLRPTYAKLLNHPWLKKYASQEEKDKVKLGDFVKEALQKNAEKSSNANNTKEQPAQLPATTIPGGLNGLEAISGVKTT